MKQQASKKARKHRREALFAKLLRNIGHPSHCSSAQRYYQRKADSYGRKQTYQA